MIAANTWRRYTDHSGLVLGFHGCDKSIGEALLSGEIEHLQSSENEYDWLGPGIYLWESDPQRAFEFAQERARGIPVSQGKIKNPFVIGVIVDLKLCLRLTDRIALSEVRAAYDALTVLNESLGRALPKNGDDKLRRNLDCMVFQMLHQSREDFGDAPYDTIRGAFWEGEEVYPGAGFNTKDHIQICVRNTDCIKGYFKPIES